MISNEKKQAISALGIHDLRNLARMWGVKSPTSMIKKDLVESIINAMDSSGADEASIGNPILHRGRPAKHNMYKKFVEGRVPEIIRNIAKERVLHPSQIGLRDEVVFHSPETQSDFAVLVEKSGYIKKMHENYYFFDLSSEDVVYVPQSYMIKYELELGDLLNTSASRISENLFIVENLYRLNRQKTSKLSQPRNLCSFNDITAPKAPITIQGITEGSKVEFETKSYVSFIQEKMLLLGEFYKHNFEIKTVGVCLQNIDIVLLKEKIYGDNFLCSQEHDPIISYENVNDAIYNVAVSAREGRKVVLIVFGLEDIVEEMKKYFSLNTEINERERDLHVLQLERKLSCVNKVLVNDGSVTLIMVSKPKTNI